MLPPPSNPAERGLASRPVAPATAAVAVVVLWLVVTAVALASRPLLPVDETRYAAVAWEMWLRGDFLVPQLNGATYSHKPPLLFWLIDAGWLVNGGPSLLWARLVGPLCSALDLWLVHRLARRLWPGQRDLALLAPLVLLGTVLWTVYGTLLLFDTLLTACVLIALLGILRLREGSRRGVLLLALGVGAGVLAKGPVVLLHVLPVALLVRWWDVGGRVAAEGGSAATAPPAGRWPDGQQSPGGARWAAWVAVGVLGGAGLALLWAVPAALAGGPAYAREIFLGQTTGRIVRSFAHQRPLWWYMPQLLLILLPWWVWPAIWGGARRTARMPPDRGIRFCLAWAVSAIVAFSLVSGKQVHYLLPELPAIALLIARVLVPHSAVAGDRAGSLDGRGSRSPSVILPALTLALPGVALVLAGIPDGALGDRLPLPADLTLPPLWAAALLALIPPAVALAGASRLRHRRPQGEAGADAAGSAIALAAATVALVATAHAVVLPGIAERLDLTPVSGHLRELEDAGVPLAHVGPYAGQYAFTGRMRRPLQEIPAASVDAWLASHPGGRVVTYRRDGQPPPDADFVQRYGRGWVVVLRAPPG